MLSGSRGREVGNAAHSSDRKAGNSSSRTSDRSSSSRQQFVIPKSYHVLCGVQGRGDSTSA